MQHRNTPWNLLGIIVAIKIILFLWAGAHIPPLAHQTYLTIWDRWDSNVYKTIAEQWYSPVNVAPDYPGFLSHFPPLYPIAIFFLSNFFRLSSLVGALIISWAGGIAAAWLLYELVLDTTHKPNQAALAALAFTLYPLSYFTIAPYAESLAIFCILASFYALHKKSFVWAGVFGAAAILTRLPSIMILPAYAVVLWKLNKSQSTLLWRATLSLVLIPLCAVLIYLGINWTSYGDPLFFKHEYATNPYSSKVLIIPFKETWNYLWDMARHFPTALDNREFMMVHGWNALFTAFALVLTFVGIRMGLPLEYSVYALGSIIFFASFDWGISNARYTLAVFPIFMVIAQIRRKPVLAFTLAAFAILLLHFTGIFTSGAWAF